MARQTFAAPEGKGTGDGDEKKGSSSDGLDSTMITVIVLAAFVCVAATATVVLVACQCRKTSDDRLKAADTLYDEERLPEPVSLDHSGGIDRMSTGFNQVSLTINSPRIPPNFDGRDDRAGGVRFFPRVSSFRNMWSSARKISGRTLQPALPSIEDGDESPTPPKIKISRPLSPPSALALRPHLMKSVDIAITTQNADTKGLSRSPMTAKRPNMPRKPTALGWMKFPKRGRR